MPITVQCSCGKSFRVKDEYAGRKGLCPACKSAVIVPAGKSADEGMPFEGLTAEVPPQAPAPLPPVNQSAPPKKKAAGKVTRFDPAAAAAKKQTVQTPRVAFSPRAILFFSLLIGVPTLLFLGKIGPVNAMQQWQALEPKLNGYTHDVVQRTIMLDYKDVEFDEFTQPPKVTNIMIDGPIMMIRLPKEIFIQGRSSEGRFRGHYYPHEKRFDMEIGTQSNSVIKTVSAHIDNDAGVLDKVEVLKGPSKFGMETND